MSLPTDFNSWEHFQDIWKKTHNKEVRQWFRDLDPDTLDLDLKIPRQSLYLASLIDDKDSALQCICKWIFFNYDIRRGQAFTTPIYGIPIEDYNQSFKYKPQITLLFVENAHDVEPEYEPCTGQISFRLIQETSQTITELELKLMATKIKSLFAKPRYKWRKGKEIYSYRDKEKGYELKVYARAELDAKNLIEQVLDIQNHKPDWDLLRKNVAPNETAAFPTIPGTQIILGKSKKKPRSRPITDVYFTGAICTIHGLKRPIPLVDLTYQFPDAYQTA
ncbi:hypothetical protein [Aphanothece sacrum]|uniref:Uncharacterized protein n=1 Tax=Aphanothece sacrum FPU1 TaxID=1920663 RepID=A0A401IEI9_APHSA|nr:hypothetical protein [Aphanothece sacrum]GBF79702.1 hypothetical protein AsFPU1_1101 [Aphanothece sacrum FPU1]GBF87163.1 hypothetical protein AsFPU3_4245 [Aphanothece sacrum FPU3]